MIIILKKQADERKVEALKQEMISQGLSIHESEGAQAGRVRDCRGG